MSSILGIVIVLFWMNWRMALVLFSITPLIVLVSIWFRRGARATYRQVRARIAAISPDSAPGRNHSW